MFIVWRVPGRPSSDPSLLHPRLGLPEEGVEAALGGRGGGPRLLAAGERRRVVVGLVIRRGQQGDAAAAVEGVWRGEGERGKDGVRGEKENLVNPVDIN